MLFPTLRNPLPEGGGKLHQFFLVMRITTILLLAGFLQVSAAGLAQKITISGKDIPLKVVFKTIEKQTGYVFAYDDEVLVEAKNISIHAVNLTVKEVLDECLRDQPLYYTIEDKTIFIKKKLPEKKANLTQAISSTYALTGSVKTETGTPLAGASVTIKGLKKAGITDSKGQFVLEGVPAGKYTLQISFVGYESFEMTINVADNLVAINAILKQALNILDEAQVIAYGTTTQRLSTGNVSTVRAADIEKQPVSNILLALEGRIPGLFITQNTGLPGGGITIRIQGQNSLSRGSDPLYVIDGVPYISQLLPNISTDGGILGPNGNSNPSYAPSGGGNPLSFINPADIESISILKDADATAIYGSRAANGVILITTKKGMVSPNRLDVNIQSGWGKVTRMLPLLNTQQYLEMRREAKTNDSSMVRASDYDINGTWDSSSNTDWQKKLIGGTSHYTDAHTSISGGAVTERTNTTFLIGAGYHVETTVFPGDLSDKKGSLHFNFTHTSKKIRVQFFCDYMVDNNSLISRDLTQNAIKLPPNAPALYAKDGTLNWALAANGNSTWVNPLSYLSQKYSFNNKNLISNTLISYQILPGLELKSNFGYNNLQTNEISVIPLSSIAPDRRPTKTRFSQFSNGNIETWNIEPQLTYKSKIGKGILDFLAGTTILKSNSNLQQFNARGFNSDQVMKDISAASTVSVSNSIASIYRYNAMFGRFNFNWQNKYIINVAVRRDGSSRFGPENLFHNFGSISGAWLFSNENILNKMLPCLSFGKFRMSYGVTGNDQIGDYQFMNLYIPYSVDVAYQDGTGLIPEGLPNSHLQWEETRKFQFGLDIGFLKDRLLFNSTYYVNRSSNLLQAYALPILTGNNQIQVNFPATVQNSGWEFLVNLKNIDGKLFKWTSMFNLAIPKNKLVSFPDLASSSYASTYIVGQTITIHKSLNLIGVNPSTGLYSFRDSHGSVTSSPDYPGDATALVNTDPKFYGGFQNSLSYKGFECDILFQFTKQTMPNYYFGNRPGAFLLNLNTGSIIANQPVFVLNRWQKKGDISSIQKFSASYPSAVLTPFSRALISEVAYSDASYIRLRNLSISWQLPDKWKQKMHLRSARIYLLGQNLLTITNFKGMDPESSSVLRLPPLKVLTFGIQFIL